MSVRGSQAKIDITNKILEVFPGSFTYEKEIRVPYIEDGIMGQIKIVLTAAKTPVENCGDAVSPGGEINFEEPQAEPAAMEPTEEEKANLVSLLEKLGL